VLNHSQFDYILPEIDVIYLNMKYISASEDIIVSTPIVSETLPWRSPLEREWLFLSGPFSCGILTPGILQHIEFCS